METTKLTLMRYGILLQAMREVLVDESYLWWLVVLMNTSERDETSVDTAYTRYAKHESADSNNFHTVNDEVVHASRACLSADRRATSQISII